MSHVFIAVTMWIAAAVALRSAGARKDMSVGIACTLMALSLTANVDPVYNAVDPLLGDRNVLDLVKHSFFVGAIYFLARGVRRSTPDRSRALSSSALAWAVLGLQTAAFTQIQMAGSTNDFMDTFGRQPAAVAYSLTHFIYFGAALGAMGWACLRILCTRGLRASMTYILLALGGAFSVVATLVIVGREFSRLADLRQLIATLDQGYDVLLLASVACVGGGLAMPRLIRMNRMQGAHRDLVTLNALHQLRNRLSGARPGLEDEPAPPADFADAAHQLVISIHDHLLLDPTVQLTRAERKSIARGEALATRTDKLNLSHN